MEARRGIPGEEAGAGNRGDNLGDALERLPKPCRKAPRERTSMVSMSGKRDCKGGVGHWRRDGYGLTRGLALSR